MAKRALRLPWCAVAMIAACASTNPPAHKPDLTDSTSMNRTPGSHAGLPSTAVDKGAISTGTNDVHGCNYDEPAKRACDERGSGFRYGPTPLIYCKGIAPREGEMAARRERIRSSPCTCYDVAAIARRRRMCSMVP